ncbi:hypothetical protein HanRHA438_Chr05g0211791 [Helianthus annuus]|nr:hypothetical protein HanRHA438_Chr05g0211791 [Helianthus annuus]
MSRNLDARVGLVRTAHDQSSFRGEHLLRLASNTNKKMDLPLTWSLQKTKMMTRFL